MKKILWLIVLVSIGACKTENSDLYNGNFELNHVKLGISFPPVANTEQRNFTAPLLKELKTVPIRIGENWDFREPTQGSFNWQPLDDRINWAANNGFEVLLTIQSNGPSWACSSLSNDNSCVYNDNNAFKNYIEKLLQRYPNKIAKIQFGNEWQSDFWYIGTEQDFVVANNIVYDAVQQYSPNTTFVLGGFTTISLRFLAGCNGLISDFTDDDGNTYDQSFLDANCSSNLIQTTKARIDYVLANARYDEVDIHLYDDVENWSIYYDNFKQMVQCPIIVTEFGGPNVNIEPSDEYYQAKQLKKYIQKIDELAIEEAYYFKLVEGTANPAHANTGLIRGADLQKKESFEVFKRFTN